MFIVDNRIAEIREKLGPLLDEMGIEASVRFARRSAIVSFLPKPGETRFSPVEIVFGDRGHYLDDDHEGRQIEDDRQASWNDAYVKVHKFHCRPLGETGWEAWESQDRKQHRIRRKGKDLYRWLSRLILSNGVVPTGGVTPFCVASHSFANAYTMVARTFPDVRVDQEFPSDDGSPTETLSFLDAQGRSVEISMRVGDAHSTVLIDGELVMTIEQEDTRSVRRLALDLARQPPEDRPGL
ncbi:hypothetical protein [Rhizobium leguminosarum]|uniref:hypothetical protein n=1 Tax=Rhizobium leguminosarum TaxID=384 RepID=UPI001C949810|nr:hypothetical protein [Rhizobium leguminosarum]MBY5646368.1 hypothetical protein [Rhizobium leguminosarum]